MNKAIVFGAGNIGRGLVGRIFSEAKLEVVFIDINTNVINTLNEKGSYPLYVTAGKEYIQHEITNVRAVNGCDIEAVCNETDDAYICATAIGVNILSSISRTIAQIIRHRYNIGNKKILNFILCENKIDVHLYMLSLIKNQLNDEEYEFYRKYIGFCQSSIGCMVPAPPKEIIERSSVAICVEDYNKIYTDKSGAIGELPPIPNLIGCDTFSLYINRKLFMHNMSHSFTAYLGFAKGYTYIWEAIRDDEIRNTILKALDESSVAMSRHYGVSKEELYEYSLSLVERYDNELLLDTVARVGNDPKRKLSPVDRLTGAALFCLENGVVPKIIAKGIAYGYRFSHEKDTSACEIQEYIKDNSLDAALEKYSGIRPGDKLYELVKEYFN